MNVLSLQMAKWKTIVVVWSNLVAAAHTHTATLLAITAAENSYESRFCELQFIISLSLSLYI